MDSAIKRIVGKSHAVEIGHGIVHNPYFFLEEELDGAKKRHLKIWKGKYYDYIAHKEFSTIQEWVTDCGATLDSVVFGQNRKPEGRRWWYADETNYIPLNQLLKMAGYTAPSKDMDVEDITAQMSKLMESKGLTIGHVHVRTDGDIFKWETFMSM